MIEAFRVKQVVPLAAAQFPRPVSAEGGFLAEQLFRKTRGVLFAAARFQKATLVLA